MNNSFEVNDYKDFTIAGLRDPVISNHYICEIRHKKFRQTIHTTATCEDDLRNRLPQLIQGFPY